MHVCHHFSTIQHIISASSLVRSFHVQCLQKKEERYNIKKEASMIGYVRKRKHVVNNRCICSFSSFFFFFFFFILVRNEVALSRYCSIFGAKLFIRFKGTIPVKSHGCAGFAINLTSYRRS